MRDLVAAMTRRRWLRRYLWGAIALQGLVQLYFLFAAVLQRWGYPYDLEWMEGGMLAHAARIADGTGIYVEPSVDFIPYLYTPLYPGLLAALEPVFGISYAVARTISVLSIVGILALIPVALVRPTAQRHRPWAWVGAALAAGYFAATYPWVDGWYDLARGDTLFLAMVIGGLVALYAWAHADQGWRGHARVAGAAAILALSFFCKQTGVLYVLAGGALLLVLNWRRLPAFVGTAGLIGLGGTWLMNRATGGWFWTYVFEVHQAHDCNQDRFEDSFGAILWRFPAVTLIIAIALVAVGTTWAAQRKRPPGSGPLFAWTWLYAVSCVVGAVGFATQWAHNNAYIPAMLTGAIAAGAALPALAGAVSAWGRVPRALELGVAGLAALVLWQNLYDEYWQPAKWVPTRADRQAGDRLIERIRAIDGDVLIPFHPWYGVLAGKELHVHRMGVLDVSYVNHSRPELRCFWVSKENKRNPPPWKIRGLKEAVATNEFAAIVWDNRAIDPYFPNLKQFYRPDDDVPKNARPRLYTGARVVPKEIWVPSTPAVPPPNARVLWNFEDGALRNWTIEGTAWGRRPTSRKLPNQGTVRNYRGRYWISSMHGGDAATGTLTSPEFNINGSRITLLISGGKGANLRAELYVEEELIDFASPTESSERMTELGWHVAPYKGRRARIVLVDKARGSWGHLNIDEIWEWE